MKITFSKIPVLTLLGLALFVSDRAQAQSTDGDTVNVGEVTITATGLTTSTRKTGYGVSQIKSKSIVSSGVRVLLLILVKSIPVRIDSNLL